MIAVLALMLLAPAGRAQGRADWLRDARWGVMTHFLAEWMAPAAHKSVEDWNKLVDGFDVQGLAGQLQSAGAGYYLITIGQNSGFYISPNATYDRLTGIKPSKCSRRDLWPSWPTPCGPRASACWCICRPALPGAMPKR